MAEANTSASEVKEQQKLTEAEQQKAEQELHNIKSKDHALSPPPKSQTPDHSVHPTSDDKHHKVEEKKAHHHGGVGKWLSNTFVPSSRLIHAGNLDPASFAAFGEVIQNPETHDGKPGHLESVKANQGSATKWLDVTRMHDFYGSSSSRIKAKCVVNMFVCQPRRLEERDVDFGKRKKMVFPVKILERHPYTPQTFVPLGVSAKDRNARYLVVVAPTLPNTSNRAAGELQPPYPTPDRDGRANLEEKLVKSRPSPYANEHKVQLRASSHKLWNEPQRKGSGMPDLDKIQAFIARGDQAVTYGAGTWHAPMVVLGDMPIDFVVVQYANGVANDDCQEVGIEVSDHGQGLAVEIEDANLFTPKL